MQINYNNSFNVAFSDLLLRKVFLKRPPHLKSVGYTLCLKKVYPLMFDKVWQMWTDFQNSFTNSFIGKFSMYTPQRLYCYTTL